MTILVVGGSGATGRLLIGQLLQRGINVRAIVRSADRLPDEMKRQPGLHVIEASLLDLSDDELRMHVRGCVAVASCLGHNLTFKGLFLPPRRLVTDAVQRLCQAAKANLPTEPVRFVLMNTAGNSNRDLNEPLSNGQRWVIRLLRHLIPPHADNEQAADFLRTQIIQNDQSIEWVVVRPDSLINNDEVTPYELHPSPTRSAIFDPGKTSRINVGHFMAELLTKDELWAEWQGKMPVIYNAQGD